MKPFFFLFFRSIYSNEQLQNETVLVRCGTISFHVKKKIMKNALQLFLLSFLNSMLLFCFVNTYIYIYFLKKLIADNFVCLLACFIGKEEKQRKRGKKGQYGYSGKEWTL